LERLLAGLRAVAEPSRLRLLALCATSELTVSELTTILGQSQPRVSRHLKQLCEAGLLDRFREGSWVFYALAPGFADRLTALLPMDDPTLIRDQARLDAIRRDRERAAAAYFARNAPHWDEIRSLHVPEAEVERCLLGLHRDLVTADLLDIGTGTGRMLEVFGPYVERAVGVDLSRDMLAVARVNLDRAQLRHCSLRASDMYALPFAEPRFDLVLIHQVLHFAERPADAVAEAARVLKPGGRLVIVDFARHALEMLREMHAHRRLGFADEEVADWVQRAGLSILPPVALPGEPLTVKIWQAVRRSEIETAAPAAHQGRTLASQTSEVFS
jgi:ArsR family transcriptional regulator